MSESILELSMAERIDFCCLGEERESASDGEGIEESIRGDGEGERGGD